MNIASVTFLFLILLSNISSFAQGEICLEMEPLCIDPGTMYTVGTGATAEVGNDYGCLFTQPNPSWYYLEITEEGAIEMEAYGDSDIDFIIWGPFDDLADATSNCGTLGTTLESPIVDCSYSGVAYETPEIPSALVGEVYILLITNYSEVEQEVFVSKIGGDGNANCDIVIEPTVSVGTFTLFKNGEPIPEDGTIDLCDGDDFNIITNEDYLLPPDTIAAPVGDGGYSAQILWLVYDAAPTTDNPEDDPGFLDKIIPMESLMDSNSIGSEFLADFGCGTYFFVPITGDDGIGANDNIADGITDNGEVHWDLNGNELFDMGEPIQENYSCVRFIDFIAEESICDDSDPLLLTAYPEGGNFSGVGVEDHFFNPVVAGEGTQTVYYVLSDSLGCSATDSVHIEVVSCLTIAENTLLDVIMFPNPVELKKDVTLRNELNEERIIYIHNAIGQLVFTAVWSGNDNSISLENNLNSGLFFLSVSVKSTGQELISTKLVVR